MKSTKKLALATSILALTLVAFPNQAAAGIGATPPPPIPAASNGTHFPGVTIDALFVLSLLNLL
jgi:hypothetical protein